MATLLERVKIWNSQWRYDYWWRQRHKVAYNSPEHRVMNPLDIAFEYHEYVLAQTEIGELTEQERKVKLLKEGQLWEPRFNEQLWNKLDLSSFNEK